MCSNAYLSKFCALYELHIHEMFVPFFWTRNFGLGWYIGSARCTMSEDLYRKWKTHTHRKNKWQILYVLWNLPRALEYGFLFGKYCSLVKLPEFGHKLGIWVIDLNSWINFYRNGQNLLINLRWWPEFVPNLKQFLFMFHSLSQ